MLWLPSQTQLCLYKGWLISAETSGCRSNLVLVRLSKSCRKNQRCLQAASLECQDLTDTSKPVFITHVHDEASMRLRSYDTDLPSRILRGRSSKIQNNSVTIRFGGNVYPWLQELQPLMRKDGPTIAEALVRVTEDIIRALVAFPARPWSKLKCIHLLTVDGINTNLNAARRLCYKFCTDPRLNYSLISWKCASHVVNLVVVVAICGSLLSEPIEDDDECAACSRFFHVIRYVLEPHR